MRKLFWGGLLLLLLAGCGWGKYQIPKQDYQQNVQVLGVLPLLVDKATDFDYPHKEPLFDLLTRSVNGKHELLVERIRKKKGYFDVRSLAGAPDLLTFSLLSGENPRDADGRLQGYQFNPQSIAELAERNVVDALLVVVFSGARIEETRRSRTMIESLRTGYSDIMVTAAVVDQNSQVLWELTGEDAFQALLLQYADFDEAHYNQTDLVRVKNIGIGGIEKVLEEPASDDGKVGLPKMYDELFARIAAGISPGLLDSLK